MEERITRALAYIGRVRRYRRMVAAARIGAGFALVLLAGLAWAVKH